MLDATIRTQLRSYLGRLQRPVELCASLDESPGADEIRTLLMEIGELSELVHVSADGGDERRPSFTVAPAGEAARVRFAGAPLGHEFSSLVLALLQAGGHPPQVAPETAAQIRALPGPLAFETFMSLSCHNCPDVVQALNLMAALNPAISHVTIDGARYTGEVVRREIMAVPAVFLNGAPFGHGRMTLEEILARLDTATASRAAAALDRKDVFDVLVVGGGPAGAAAAIYAARKGIRTGLVAERFGGQVLDTLAIENFVSVPRTEGPRLAVSLEEHVKDYAVDIMNVQRAVRLVPGDVHRVELESGASLRARTVVLATGARWRDLGVPGERENRTKGVAYCPHCDGPLFKGKRVAVIGGGNSGVEAAIDLANLAAEVHLLEFDERLRADAVLQERLASLPNVQVLTGAATTGVSGDGTRVTGLAYADRATGAARHMALDGVFVQIGLLPNTEWLRDTVALSPRGEIEIDARGQTSLPGVFAAGDCTTAPFKQIVISMGGGAAAALSAFEHLVRMPIAA
jgi:alkyl hydroperoxide reductase subunit F